MKKVKAFLDLVPLLLLWAMLSIFLWSFVFNFLTDTAPENKIVLFIDAPLQEESRLAVQLEEIIAEPVEMVQVRAFAYAMMDSTEIERADLYIVSASQAETYREWFAPLPEALAAAGDVLQTGGVPCGVKIFDAATGTGAAAEYIAYVFPGKEPEDYYLFAGSKSLHISGHENAVDDQAVACALRLLEIP